MKIEINGIEEDIIEEDGTITHLIPEVALINGDRNLIIRMIDPNGNLRLIYEYRRATANVKFIEL